jgi:hypothetical protein
LQPFALKDVGSRCHDHIGSFYATLGDWGDLPGHAQAGADAYQTSAFFCIQFIASL